MNATILHHIALAVRDTKRSAAFFGDVFGFTLLEGAAAGAAEHGRAMTLRAPNGYLELLTAAAAAPRERQVHEAGITHISIQSRHMDALYQQLVHVGARPHSPPTALGTGYTYVYARDAEGNIVEIEGVPYAPPEQPPWLAHVALATHDIERLAAFYHTVLGGERRGGYKIGPNPLIDQVAGLSNVEAIPVWITGANISLELWRYLHPPTMPAEQRQIADPGFSHICFEVANLSDALDTWVAAGARLAAAPVTANGITAAYVRDPDGNLLELAQFTTEARHPAGALEVFDLVQRVEALRPGS